MSTKVLDASIAPAMKNDEDFRKYLMDEYDLENTYKKIENIAEDVMKHKNVDLKIQSTITYALSLVADAKILCERATIQNGENVLKTLDGLRGSFDAVIIAHPYGYGLLQLCLDADPVISLKLTNGNQ